MKTCKIKKLYKGRASVRDYIVKECIEKDEDLVIEYKGKVMTLTVEQMQKRFQFHQQNFQSQFSTQTYQLIDFLWWPDGMLKS